MTTGWHHAADLLAGPLPAAAWPLLFLARLCDLRPRFIPKGEAGRGYRAVARNGRVLLASDRPLAELAGRVARLRLQTWRRAVLPGDRPTAHGLLLCVRCSDVPPASPTHVTRLVRTPEEPFDLALALGGGLVLVFRPAGENEGSPSPLGGEGEG
jgi:hypothetical protein